MFFPCISDSLRNDKRETPDLSFRLARTRNNNVVRANDNLRVYVGSFTLDLLQRVVTFADILRRKPLLLLRRTSP